MPSLYREVGAVTFPIVWGGGADLSPLDPALDIMLALFASAIADELGAAWTSAVRTGTPVATATTPVRRRYPYAPDPKHLTQGETKFPALFVYRQEGSGSLEQFSLWQRRHRSRWGVDYFLGPIDLGQVSKLQGILPAVKNVIGEVIEDGGHDSYQSGARVLGNIGLGCAGFSTVELVDWRCGGAKFADNERGGPTYWACSCTIETTEFAKVRDGSAADFLGASFVFGTGNGEGIDPDMVGASTDSVP